MKITVFPLLFLLAFPSCKGQINESEKTTEMYTNDLIHESSPYLLQHAHNPVNWYPWGEAAFQKAKDENKLVIISIGYAACHWCHVMEHESFEDLEVAQYMNAHFVCIKVDREERPDVDQIYMTAAQLMNGSGGWPLNAFALPDGKPFYAGTYFQKDKWMEVLQYFVKLQQEKPESIVEQSKLVTEAIEKSENITISVVPVHTDMDHVHKSFQQWKPQIDFTKGGAKRAPKFPMPSNWEYLLEYYFLTKNTTALSAVTATLDNMARGGIYDQIGGGFSRYSTDMDWKVPHFEKMLYDNAQLVSLYAHAFQLTQDPLYKKTVVETLAFIERELTAPGGGFYSSLDADSEGEEGKYYVWTLQELQDALGDEAPLFINYYQVTTKGNWENGQNILIRKADEKALLKKYNLNVDQLQDKMQQANNSLRNIRSSRIPPRLDDKILTSWNALMITGYVDAYKAIGDEKYLNIALKNAEFLAKNMLTNNGELQRNFKNGTANIHGLLDDYAFTISAFLSLYQVSFDEQWLYLAKKMTDYSIKHFFDNSSGMFFYTHMAYTDLIARKMEISDNVIPSSNSEMAKNAFFLGLYFDDSSYTNIARQMLANIQDDMHQNISFYANWARLELQCIQAPYEVAIVGPQFRNALALFGQQYIPNAIFLGGADEGTLRLLQYKSIPDATTIYVCQNKTCQLPTTDVKVALQQMLPEHQ